MIILGIDPGSRITGYGIINNQSNRMQYVDSGFLKLSRDSLAHRLGEIFEQLTGLIRLHQPVHMSIENVFMHKNADSALKLGQARGAAICAAHQGDLQVHEYAPREVKLAIVGSGSAQKEQVQHMVRKLLSISHDLQADEADALAIAICHAQHHAMQLKTGIPASAFNRNRHRRR